MPAKWQQWMPLDVNEWRGSPAVKAMHPCARSGYLDLLLGQWQTEDCSISPDPLDLAELSGLGDKMWGQYGAKVLRKFEILPDGRLRNAVCFKKWLEAKRIFESRKGAAQKTNAIRSSDGHRNGQPTQEDENRSRSAYTRTTVVPVDVSVDVPVPVNGDSGLELGLASWLFEELNIPCGNSEVRIAADAIRKIAKEGGTTQDAANYLREMGRLAQASGESVDRFWFTGRRYTGQKPKKNDKRAELESERAEVIRRLEVEHETR